MKGEGNFRVAFEAHSMRFPGISRAATLPYYLERNSLEHAAVFEEYYPGRFKEIPSHVDFEIA